MFVIYCVFNFDTTFATQFRYGHINWRIPDPELFPNVVEFQVQIATQLDLGIGSIVPTVGSLLNPGMLDFGDGSPTQTISLVVSVVNGVINLLQGTYIVRHNYLTNAPRNYTAFYASGSRLSLLKNNANTFYNVSTVVNVLQYVRRNNVSVLNQSPIAASMAIVNVYTNQINTFQIPAFDRERQSLSFVLASAVDMGDITDTQPPQFSVSSNGTITFDTTGLGLGYWTTQIKISDGFCYVVVDFLLRITTPPPSLPCLLPVAPTLSIFANALLSLRLQTSISTGALPTPITSALPSGASLSSLSLGVSAIVWTPTMRDIGSYVINIGCETPLGLLCSAACQSSVIVNVVTPYCGYGTVTPTGCNISTTACACVCPAGFDPTKNCTACLTGYYGSNCTACQCVHGTCASGFSGTGQCTCNSGWKGSKCDVAIRPCNFTAPGYVRQMVNTTSSLVNPTFTTVLLTNAVTQFNISTYLPAVPAKLDILILMDVSQTLSLSTLLNLQGVLAVNFVNLINPLATSLFVGLSTFSNPTSCLLSLSFGVKLALTSSTTDFLGALALYAAPVLQIGCTSSSQGNQLAALTAASGSINGWRTDAVKVIIVITSSTFGEGGVYANRSSVKTALLGANIVPIFITPSSIQATYTSLTTSLGFGSVASVASTFTNALSIAGTAVTTALRTVTTIVTDVQNFTQSVSPTTVVSSLPAYVTSVVNMKVSSVNQTAAPISDIVITTVGWGVAIITPQLNRAPSASLISVTTREDIGVNIPFNGTDADSDSLFVLLQTLPSRGTLYVNSSSNVPVSAGVLYQLPDGQSTPLFYYAPNLHYYGADLIQFYLNDGCANSSLSNITLAVTFFNYPPTANNVATNTYENVNLTIQLVVSDLEDPASALISVIRVLPDPALGTLYHLNGTMVQINDQLAPSASHRVVFAPTLYVCCDVATFTYQVMDTMPQYSGIATANIFIIKVNQPPSASAPSPIVVDRGVPTAITLNVFDHDTNDVETFSITQVGQGSFADVNGNPIGSTPYALSPITLPANTGSQTVYYTALNNSMASSSLQFIVTDHAGNTSSTVTVTITVKPNLPPVTTPVARAYSSLHGVSPTATLGGTDPDPADTPDTLTIVLDQLPTKGILNVGGANVTALPASFPNNVAFAVFGNNQLGNDQFSFYVLDVIGSRSTSFPVPITYINTNRPPSGSVTSLVTLEDVELVSRVIAADPDGDTPLTVWVTVLPTVGTLSQFDGTAITTVPTALTDPQLQFRFMPVQYASGSPYADFSCYVDDGTGLPNSNSPTVVATISVTQVNYPPIAIPSQLSILQGSAPASLLLNTSDIETPASTVAIIVSLPAASSGTLTDTSGTPLTIGQSIAHPSNILFAPISTWFGVTSFTFKANDGTVDSNTFATVSITVTHVNHAPTSSIALGVAVRTVSFPITLTGGDVDISDNLTFTITQFIGGGQFFYPDSKRSLFPATVPFNLPAVLTVPAFPNQVSTMINFVAPATASGNGYATLSFYVTDQTGSSSAVTTAPIDIAANNPPTANLLAPIAATQDFMTTSFILSGSDLDVADATTLQIILVSLPTKGTLYFANGTAITSPGVISFTSSTTLTYLTTQRGSDQFAFQIMDNLGGLSVVQTASIIITPTNHPPVAIWTGICVGNEDTTFSVTQMSAVDPDPDDTVFTYYVANAPSKGTLTQSNGTPCSGYPCLVSSSNTLLFTPVMYDYGTPYTSFSFFVLDSHGLSSNTNASATISVIHVNHPPVAVSSSSSGLENTNITVAINISDIDTPNTALLSVIILSLPPVSLGVLTMQNGTALKVGDAINYQSLIFVPVQYANGNASFTFRASDGQAFSNIASVLVIVIAVIQPPSCGISPPSPFIVPKFSSTTIQLLSNDPDGNEVYSFFLMSYQAADNTGVLGGPLGEITASTKLIASQPTTGFSTQVFLQYNVSAIITSLNISFFVFDGTYNSSICTVALIVTSNSAPSVIQPPNVTTLESTMSGVIVLNGTDTDDNWATARIVIVRLPQNGVLYVNSSYTITSTGFIDANLFGVTYLPNTLFYGSDSFQFAIRDESGTYSATSTVNINVIHVNHPPTVTVGPISTLEDVPVNISQIYANDIDVGDTLQLVITSVSSGSLSFLNGNLITTFPVSIPSPFAFTYTPVPDANGPVSLLLYVTDGINNTRIVNATINVVAANDPPVTYPGSLTILENDPTATITLNITDIDSPVSSLRALILSLPSASLGGVTNATGQRVSVGSYVPSPFTLYFTPAPYSSGSGTIVFFARDESLASVNSSAFSVTVTHVNHPPVLNVASSVTATRGVELVVPVSVTDMDRGDIILFTLSSASVSGGVLSNTSGGPALTAGTVFSSGQIALSGATLQSSLYFTAPATASGSNYASFVLVATDSGGASSSPITVTVAISPNHPPTTSPASLSATQDTRSAAITLAGADQDVADANTVRLFITVLPTKGVLYMGSTAVSSVPTQVTGGISYQTSQRGADQFAFHATDTLGSSSPDRIVPITITPVNHAPSVSFTGSNLNVLQNANLTINQISASDPDSDRVIIYLSALPVPSLGRLYQMDGTPITVPNTPITDSQRRFVYVPAGADLASQTTSFSFYGSDNQGASNSNTSVITVPISITHINIPPNAYSSSLTLPYGSSSPQQLAINVTDLDTPSGQLNIVILSIPSSSIGTLTSAGSPVTVGQQIPYPFSVQFVPTGSGYGFTSFSFYATDGTDISNKDGTYSFAVNNPINAPPVASATSTYTATRGVPLSILLGAHDDDYLETFTYGISAQAAGGSFANGATNVALSPPTFSITQAQDNQNYVTYASLLFTAPATAQGDGYLNISFNVQDSAGASSTGTVQITVGIAPNNLPVATFTGTVGLLEVGNSSEFTLGGTDADIIDASNLKVTILSLPARGTLMLVGGGAVTTIGGMYSNPSFYIVGNPLAFGSDQFSFAVVDNLGGQSAVLQVPILITQVNHPPTAGVNIQQGFMNQPLTITVYANDIDNDGLSLYVSEVPSIGTLYQSDGTVITGASASNPVLITSSSGNLIYVPPTNAFGVGLSNFSFFAADNSGAPNNRSAVLSGSINVARVDLPPTTQDATATVPNGGSVSFYVNVTDPQGYPTVVTITSFPQSGGLFRSDGSAITPSSPNTGSDHIVTYQPQAGVYGQNITLSYQATATTSSLSSNTGTATISVYRTYGPPSFTGQTAFTIPENSMANMLFSGSSETGSYYFTILSVGYNGTLVYSDGSSETPITTFPFIMNATENRAKFTPTANVSGNPLAFIVVQVVDEYGQSAAVNITVTVFHINIPPTVVPATFYSLQDPTTVSNWTLRINVTEAVCSVVTWSVDDPDSLPSNISCILVSTPFRGSVHAVLPNGTVGPTLTTSAILRAESNGLFQVAYCPEIGTFGRNYASFSVLATDNIAYSSRQYATMNVYHINQAPYFNITQHEYNITASAGSLLTGITVGDPDAGILPIKIVLSVYFVNTTTNATLNQNASVLLTPQKYDASICNQTSTAIVCVATVQKLNTVLSQIAFNGSVGAGDFFVVFFADDMGAGADSASKATSARNATDIVVMHVIPPIVPPEESPPNNGVLTAALASGGAVGVGAAVTAYFYLKKRSPPTSTFFGLEQGIATGEINENPLYDGGITMQNAIYRAPTFAMQKVV